MCAANEPGKMLTDILGTDWLDSITTDKVRHFIPGACGSTTAITAAWGNPVSRPTVHAYRYHWSSDDWLYPACGCTLVLRSTPPSLCVAIGTVQVLLGIWGNSDSNNIKHWLPLVATGWAPSTDLQWDEATSTCRHVAKGLQVRLNSSVHSRQYREIASPFNPGLAV
jgi:hypothetical protein